NGLTVGDEGSGGVDEARRDEREEQWLSHGEEMDLSDTGTEGTWSAPCHPDGATACPRARGPGWCRLNASLRDRSDTSVSAALSATAPPADVRVVTVAGRRVRAHPRPGNPASDVVSP